MTATNLRVWLLALGALDIAFGVIYAFTPGGFSWPLVLVGLLMVLPWLAAEKQRRGAKPARPTGVPSWHPESDEHDR